MKNKTAKILILGHQRHGKDTFAELLNKYNPNLTFISSSLALTEKLIFPTLKEKYNYKTMEECYEDRVNHREEWFKLIANYNTPDKTKLAKLILSKNSMYVGLRNNEEYQACLEEDIFDFIFWVDASEIKPSESKNSFNIDFDESKMILINNNLDLESLDKLAQLWAKRIKYFKFRGIILN